MLAYILRRLVIALVAIFVLATITFFLLRLVPGDPFASPRITTEVKARLHAHYGLDKPLIEQYLIYMANLAQGDFGYSLTQRGRRVNDIIATAFPVSLDLGLRAMALAIVFGLLFGIVSALNRGKRFDYLTVVLVLVGISVPSFVVGGLLQYFLAREVADPPRRPLRDLRLHTLMPAFALSLATMATIARYMRASHARGRHRRLHPDRARQGPAAGARSSGATRSATRSSRSSPSSARSIASVLTGSFVIETIFAVPGLGPPLRHRHAEPRLHAGHGADRLLRRLPHRDELPRRRRLRPRSTRASASDDAMPDPIPTGAFRSRPTASTDALAGHPPAGLLEPTSGAGSARNPAAMASLALLAVFAAARRRRAADLALQLSPPIDLFSTYQRPILAALVRHRCARPRHLAAGSGTARASRSPSASSRRSAQMLIGVVIGCFSGLCGGRVDMAIMRFVDIMIAIPFLIWVSLLVLVLEPGHRSRSSLAFALTQWTEIARLVRGEVLRLERDRVRHRRPRPGRRLLAADRAATSSPTSCPSSSSPSPSR